jgi:hypothetical protein
MYDNHSSFNRVNNRINEANNRPQTFTKDQSFDFKNKKTNISTNFDSHSHFQKNNDEEIFRLKEALCEAID